MKIAFYVACIGVVVFLIFYDVTRKTEEPRPMRILQREDGVYEVERMYFGRFNGWSRMGEYPTLAEAESDCAWWRNRDLEKIASENKSKTLKKRVVHECR